MDGRGIVVKVARDHDAGVRFVESSDLPGLNVEAATVEAATVEGMVEKLPAVIADLMECAGDGSGFDVPIELIAHASTRVRVPRGT